MLFALTFIMCLFPMRDTDFFWHIKTGQLIWQKLTIPSHDWYTYMDADRPWIDLHWGFQLLMAGLYGLGGANAAIFCKALCYTATVFIGWHATGKHLPIWLRMIPWLPAVIAMTGRAYERPEMISLLCLACCLWLVERIPSQPRWIWAFPLIMLLWVNFHALFILGCVVWGAFLADNAATTFTPLSTRGITPQWPRPNWTSLLLVSVAMLVALLMNPYFERGLIFPLELFRKFSVENDFYGPRIGEFNSPWMWVTNNVQKFGLQYGLFSAFLNLYFTNQLILFLIALATFLLLLAHRQANLYRWLLFLGFAHLGWVATRNVNVFSLVMAVLACANLQQALLVRRASDASTETSFVAFNQLATIIIGAFAILFMTGEWARYVEEWKRFGLGEAPAWFAHEAVQFAGKPGMPSRAYLSHFGIAGTYIYHNGPDHKVFMDPRLEVCSRQTFEKYEEAEKRIVTDQPGWEEILNPDGKELPAIILDSRSSRQIINHLLPNPHWRMVFADPAACVFIPAPLADKLNLPMADPRVMFKPPT